MSRTLTAGGHRSSGRRHNKYVKRTVNHKIKPFLLAGALRPCSGRKIGSISASNISSAFTEGYNLILNSSFEKDEDQRATPDNWSVEIDGSGPSQTTLFNKVPAQSSAVYVTSASSLVKDMPVIFEAVKVNNTKDFYSSTATIKNVFGGTQYGKYWQQFTAVFTGMPDDNSGQLEIQINIPGPNYHSNDWETWNPINSGYPGQVWNAGNPSSTYIFQGSGLHQEKYAAYTQWITRGDNGEGSVTVRFFIALYQGFSNTGNTISVKLRQLGANIATTNANNYQSKRREFAWISDSWDGSASNVIFSIPDGSKYALQYAHDQGATVTPLLACVDPLFAGQNAQTLSGPWSGTKSMMLDVATASGVTRLKSDIFPVVSGGVYYCHVFAQRATGIRGANPNASQPANTGFNWYLEYVQSDGTIIGTQNLIEPYEFVPQNNWTPYEAIIQIPTIKTLGGYTTNNSFGACSWGLPAAVDDSTSYYSTSYTVSGLFGGNANEKIWQGDFNTGSLSGMPNSKNGTLQMKVNDPDHHYDNAWHTVTSFNQAHAGERWDSGTVPSEYIYQADGTGSRKYAVYTQWVNYNGDGTVTAQFFVALLSGYTGTNNRVSIQFREVPNPPTLHARMVFENYKQYNYPIWLDYCGMVRSGSDKWSTGFYNPSAHTDQSWPNPVFTPEYGGAYLVPISQYPGNTNNVNCQSYMEIDFQNPNGVMVYEAEVKLNGDSHGNGHTTIGLVYGDSNVQPLNYWWLRLDGLNSTDSQYNNPGYAQLLYVNYDGTGWHINKFGDSGAVVIDNTSSDGNFQATYQHMKIVHDPHGTLGAHGDIKAYFNGVLIASASATFPVGCPGVQGGDSHYNDSTNHVYKGFNGYKVAGWIKDIQKSRTFGTDIKAAGDIIYGLASASATQLPIGVPNQILSVSTASLPIWSYLPEVDFSVYNPTASDCTVQFQQALIDLYNAGGGTLYIPPSLSVICLGQLYYPSNGMPLNNNAFSLGAPIKIKGAGSGFKAGATPVPHASVLDWRWDGTGGNKYLNDFMCVSGLTVTQIDATHIAIASGVAYMGDNSASTTPPDNVAGSPSVNIAAWSGWADGYWFVDYDKNANLTPVYAGPIATPTTAASALTWTASSMRIALVVVVSASIVKLVEWRPRAAMFDARGEGSITFENIQIKDGSGASRTNHPVAFFKHTITIPYFNDVCFYGSGPPGVTSPGGVTEGSHDAIIHGGQGSYAPSGYYTGNTKQSGSVSGGYGGYVNNTHFLNIRHAGIFNGNANVMKWQNNDMWVVGARDGVVKFQGNPWAPPYGNYFAGNNFEMPYSMYAFLYDSFTRSNTAVGNQFSDDTTATVAYPYLTTTSASIYLNNPDYGTIMAWKGASFIIDAAYQNGMVNTNIGTSASGASGYEILSTTSGPITGTSLAHGFTTASGASGNSHLTLVSGNIADFPAGLILCVGAGQTTQEIVTVAGGAAGTNIPLTSNLVNSYGTVGVVTYPWILALSASPKYNHLQGSKNPGFYPKVSLTLAMHKYNYQSSTQNSIIGDSMAYYDTLMWSDTQYDSTGDTLNTYIGAGSWPSHITSTSIGQGGLRTYQIAPLSASGILTFGNPGLVSGGFGGTYQFVNGAGNNGIVIDQSSNIFMRANPSSSAAAVDSPKIFSQAHYWNTSASADAIKSWTDNIQAATASGSNRIISSPQATALGISEVGNVSAAGIISAPTLTSVAASNMLSLNQSMLTTDASTWNNNYNATVSRATGLSSNNGYTTGLEIQSISACGMSAYCLPVSGVIGGQTYSGTAWSLAGSASESVYLSLYFQDAGGNFLGSISSPTVANNSSTWTQIPYFSFMAPDQAAKVEIICRVVNTNSINEVHYFNSFVITPGIATGYLAPGASGVNGNVNVGGLLGVSNGYGASGQTLQINSIGLPSWGYSLPTVFLDSFSSYAVTAASVTDWTPAWYQLLSTYPLGAIICFATPGPYIFLGQAVLGGSWATLNTKSLNSANYIIDGVLGSGYTLSIGSVGRTALDLRFNGASSAFPNDYAWISGGNVFVADPGTDQHLYVQDTVACINSQTPVTVTGSSNFNLGTSGSGGASLTDGWYYLDVDPVDGVKVNPELSPTNVPQRQWYLRGAAASGTLQAGYGYNMSPAGAASISASATPTSIRLVRFQVSGGKVVRDQAKPRIQSLKDAARLGKIECRGAGDIWIRNIILKDFSSASIADKTAFVKTTTPKVLMDNVHIQGKYGVSSDKMPHNAGIVIGGPGSPFDATGEESESVTAYSAAQSSVATDIKNVGITNTKWPVILGSDANTLTIETCSFNSNNGNFQGGQLNIMGGTAGCGGNTYIGNYMEATNMAYTVNIVRGSAHQFYGFSIDSSQSTLRAPVASGASYITFGTPGGDIDQNESILDNPLCYLGAHLHLGDNGFPQGNWEMIYVAEALSASNTGILGSSVAGGSITQTGTGPWTLSGSPAARAYLVDASDGNAKHQEWVTINASGNITQSVDVLGNINSSGSTFYNHNGKTLKLGTYTFPLMYPTQYSWPSGTFGAVGITVANAFDGPGNIENIFVINESATPGGYGQPVWNVNESSNVLNLQHNFPSDNTLIHTAFRYRNPTWKAEFPGGLLVNQQAPNYTGNFGASYAFANNKYWPALGVGSGPWGIAGGASGFVGSGQAGTLIATQDAFVGAGVNPLTNAGVGYHLYLVTGVSPVSSIDTAGNFWSLGNFTTGALLATGTTFPVLQNQYSILNPNNGGNQHWVTNSASGASDGYASGMQPGFAWDFVDGSGNHTLSTDNHGPGAAPYTYVGASPYAVQLGPTLLNSLNIASMTLYHGTDVVGGASDGSTHSISAFREFASIPLSQSGGVWTVGTINYVGGDSGLCNDGITPSVQVTIAGVGQLAQIYVYINKMGIAYNSTAPPTSNAGTTVPLQVYSGSTILLSTSGSGVLVTQWDPNSTVALHSTQHEPGGTDDIYEFSGMLSPYRVETIPEYRAAANAMGAVTASTLYIWLFRAKNSFTANFLMTQLSALAATVPTGSLHQLALFTATSTGTPAFKYGSTSFSLVCATDPALTVNSDAGSFGHTTSPILAIAVGSDNTNATSSASGTIAVGSNGATLPQGTINVTGASNFISGSANQTCFSIVTNNGPQTVLYTGISGASFTGCTGGTGTMTTGSTVLQKTYNITKGQMYGFGFLSVQASGTQPNPRGVSGIGGVMLLSPIMSCTGGVGLTSMLTSVPTASVVSTGAVGWGAASQYNV